MFFERDAFAFRLLDVWRLTQRDVKLWNAGRDFSALSFRFVSDAVLETEGAAVSVQGGSLAFVPAALDYTRRASVDDLIVAEFEAIGYEGGAIEVFTPPVSEPLSRLFSEMYAVWERRATGYYYRCAALLYEILAECRAQSYRPARGAARIRPSLDYLHENYKRHDLTVGEIARASFVSEVYLRRLFKEAYGTSPQKYLMELRIRKALDLIGTGYYTLKEVAELSGYADYKYFSVEFKRAVGVSPSAYLREGGKAPPLRATR